MSYFNIISLDEILNKVDRIGTPNCVSTFDYYGLRTGFELVGRNGVDDISYNGKKIILL